MNLQTWLDILCRMWYEGNAVTHAVCLIDMLCSQEHSSSACEALPHQHISAHFSTLWRMSL
jgi:hypothetical protein